MDILENPVSGFMFVRPTNASIELHESAFVLLGKQDITQQKALSRALEPMQSSKQIKTLRLKDELFPNGRVYYEKGRRMWQGNLYNL